MNEVQIFLQQLDSVARGLCVEEFTEEQLQECKSLFDAIMKESPNFAKYDEVTRQREANHFRKMQTVHR